MNTHRRNEMEQLVNGSMRAQSAHFRYIPELVVASWLR